MNAPLTRRSLLGATAALGTVTLPVTVSMAGTDPATRSERLSPEAAALLGEFRDVASRFNSACDRLDTAQAATAYVPKAEALFVHGQDFWTLDCLVPKRRWKGGHLTYGFGEVVAAWDRWQADRAAAEVASGETAAEQHYETVCAEHEGFLFQLVHLRTADRDLMRIEAAAVLNVWSGDADLFDNAVARVVGGVVKRRRDAEDALCFSLMRDMMHGLGTACRVTA